jgi:hypothetical protein
MASPQIHGRSCAIIHAVGRKLLSSHMFRLKDKYEESKLVCNSLVETTFPTHSECVSQNSQPCSSHCESQPHPSSFPNTMLHSQPLTHSANQHSPSSLTSSPRSRKSHPLATKSRLAILPSPPRMEILISRKFVLQRLRWQIRRLDKISRVNWVP